MIEKKTILATYQPPFFTGKISLDTTRHFTFEKVDSIKNRKKERFYQIRNDSHKREIYAKLYTVVARHDGNKYLTKLLQEKELFNLCGMTKNGSQKMKFFENGSVTLNVSAVNSDNIENDPKTKPKALYLIIQEDGKIDLDESEWIYADSFVFDRSYKQK